MKTLFTFIMLLSLNSFAGGVLIVDGNGGGIKPNKSIFFGLPGSNSNGNDSFSDLIDYDCAPVWVRFIENNQNEFRFESAILNGQSPIFIDVLSLRKEELFTVHQDTEAVEKALAQSKAQKGKWKKVVSKKKKNK